jgi:hypothetical protein
VWGKTKRDSLDVVVHVHLHFIPVTMAAEGFLSWQTANSVYQIKNVLMILLVLFNKLGNKCNGLVVLSEKVRQNASDSQQTFGIQVATFICSRENLAVEFL